MNPASPPSDNPPVRQFVRKPVAARVQGKEEAGLAHLFFDSQDLSVGGAFLKSDLLLEVGELLVLELKLPEGLALDARARVAWVRRSEGSGGMGIQFIDLRQEDHAKLAAFLDAS